MSRRMSFALTEAQLLAGTKDVTRRLRWERVQAGDRLTAIRKGMGLARGQKQVVLRELVVVSTRWERLDAITADEVRREGFPGETPAGFVAFFCRANGCKPSTVVHRIEFRILSRVLGTDGPPKPVVRGSTPRRGASERLGQEPTSTPPADLGGVHS